MIVDARPGLTLPQIDTAALLRARLFLSEAVPAPRRAWCSRVPVVSDEAALEVMPQLR